jgi:hypothetical protein
MKRFTHVTKEYVHASGISRRRMIQLSLGAAGSLTTIAAFGQSSTSVLKGSFNVRDYGAQGDGSAIDTAAIQKAIDAATAVGGGRVFFPAGTYLSFSIQLRSRDLLFGQRLLPRATKGTPLPNFSRRLSCRTRTLGIIIGTTVFCGE